MPANPNNVNSRDVLSDDYHDDKIHVDFYTNSCMRIYRADPDTTCPDDDAEIKGTSVWLDGLEKQALLERLKEELD